MRFYLKLGLRNLLKNRRRSLKTVLTVVIGLCACLLAQGFISHSLWGLRESLINGGYGHVQVYQKGFLEHGNDEPFRYVIPDAKTRLREFGDIPGVKLVAPRLSFQGMVSSGEKSAIFMGTAGEPDRERKLNSFATMKAGSFLRSEKPYGVVIGRGLAGKLDVGVGDVVTLTTALKDGRINALDMEVVGIAEVQIKAYSDVMLLADLDAIQRFVGMPDSADRFVVLLQRTEDLPRTAPAIAKRCRETGLEYAEWQKLAGRQYVQPKLFFDLIYRLIMGIIVLVVIFAIVNTFNLAMQERVREIGTIRSLGTTRIQVIQIFVAESFLTGLIGGFVGLILGYGLAFVLNAMGGIPIPPPPGQARGYVAMFKPGFLQAVQLWGLFLATATAAGFYPALKASRLRIVDALRWI